jgi:hypothetical protein
MTKAHQKPFFCFATFLFLALLCLWLAFSFSSMGRNIAFELAKHVPGWAAWANLVLVLLLWALAAGPLRISLSMRVPFLAFALCSLVVFEICFSRYPWPSIVTLVLFLFEVYWLIPKWNLRHTDKRLIPG